MEPCKNGSSGNTICFAEYFSLCVCVCWGETTLKDPCADVSCETYACPPPYITWLAWLQPHGPVQSICWALAFRCLSLDVEEILQPLQSSTGIDVNVVAFEFWSPNKPYFSPPPPPLRISQIHCKERTLGVVAGACHHVVRAPLRVCLSCQAEVDEHDPRGRGGPQGYAHLLPRTALGCGSRWSLTQSHSVAVVDESTRSLHWWYVFLLSYFCVCVPSRTRMIFIMKFILSSLFLWLLQKFICIVREVVSEEFSGGLVALGSLPVVQKHRFGYRSSTCNA